MSPDHSVDPVPDMPGMTATGQAPEPLLAGRSVAVVHEWFSATGGSESVFLHIADLLPHAERFVLWKEHDAPANGLRLRESWLASTPLRRSKPLALPLMPLAWRTLSRQRFDVVISSSHAFAHLARFGRQPDTRYLSYVHSPARYLWSPGVRWPRLESAPGRRRGGRCKRSMCG